jgi:hydroxymethylbilane synthase
MTVRRRAAGDPVRIATRSSELALRQARMVQLELSVRGVASELKTFTTVGDKKLDVPLASIGGKGLFTQELEEALAKGTVDCCVHSLKDLPTEAPDGLPVLAVLEREDPRDAIVLNTNLSAATLSEIPRGSRIGTSSLRRRAQLLSLRPDLEVVELRGNVDTRLRKLAAGEADVIVLAAAGLTRLDRMREAGGRLDAELFVPAAGQGVIAVQARTGTPAADAASAVSHAATMACLQAERAAVRALGASCHAPVGISARLVAESLQIRGFAGLPDGSEWVLDEHAATVAEPGGPPDARRTEEAGRELARRMQLAGADDVLRRAEEAAA